MNWKKYLRNSGIMIQFRNLLIQPWQTFAFLISAMYRRYIEARDYDFKCALFECENSHTIPTLVNNLVASSAVPCYYREGSFEMVYLETGDFDSAIAPFVIFIIFMGIGYILALVLCAFHTRGRVTGSYQKFEKKKKRRRTRQQTQVYLIMDQTWHFSPTYF